MSKQTANDLRKLAEAADGARDKDVYVVVKDGSLELVDKQPATGDYATIRTPWGKGKGMTGGAELSVAGAEISTTADAVFASQSAFEKFVLPYYARMKHPADLTADLQKYYADEVICVFHEPGSIIQRGATQPATQSGLYAVTKSGPRFMGP